MHPPREWLEELIAGGDRFRIGELHLVADDPEQKSNALAEVLGLAPEGTAVVLGETTVRFRGGGPQGRPQLDAELFL